jgi:uncharacterized protein (DUF1501 family)
MKRRDFIKNLGMAVGGPIVLNGLGLSALARSPLFDAIDDDSDRVLVLIQLNGGNDGLNTFIPLDQYGNLYNARPQVLIPESQIIPVTDTLGFHPKIGGLKELYEEGKVGIVQSVGYPNQNRSHFRSIQIWTSASPAGEVWTSGWAGRYLDGKHPYFPNGFPNSQHPDPFAISMGFQVSETCQGAASNFAITLNDPFSLTDLSEWDTDDYSGTQFGEELAFVRLSIAQANKYSERIVAAANLGANTVEYPDTLLARQLKNVALLIAGGLKTKIYTVSLGGFDTHSAQVVEGNPTAGIHANLLETLSGAIKAFQDDLAALGLEERVLGMTFSEFGRQIRSNLSYGTDHGTAAPLLLFGPCTGGIILGDNPDIPEEVAVQEGVPMQYDFRDVYGTVLADWFGAPFDKVKEILHDNFQYLPFLICGKPQIDEESVILDAKDIPGAEGPALYNHPNPFSANTAIHFSSGSEWVRLSVFDAMGQEIRVLVDERMAAGMHQVDLNASQWPAGNYYLHLLLEQGRKTQRMVKTN